EIDELINAELGPGITATVHSGSVLFDAGVARIILDATGHNVCFLKDLDMTLTVTATVAVANGRLSFQQPSVDIDLDDIDAIICVVNGVFGGPLAIVAYAVALPFLADLLPAIGDQSVSVHAPILIPGSEMDVSVALNSATTDLNGNLILNALASVTA